jgi:catechol 2,3-dioxygenase-like lactoylglutathione lyase family enzyme
MSTTQQRVSIQKLGVVTLAVDDQDAALDWYTSVLGFEKRADTPFERDGVDGRWLTIAPPGNDAVEIALVELDDDLYDDHSMATLEGMLGADHWWTFETDDVDGTLDALREHDVTVHDYYEETEWGTFAMFEDPDGNVLQLYEPAN